MSNFVVRSDYENSPEQLKQKLLQEVVKQNKPYGLLIKKISGGETHTDSASFQVFKGKPLYMYRVYPDGREELVRGVAQSLAAHMPPGRAADLRIPIVYELTES